MSEAQTWTLQAIWGKPILFAVWGRRGYDLMNQEFPEDPIDRAMLRAALGELYRMLSTEEVDGS